MNTTTTARTPRRGTTVERARRQREVVRLRSLGVTYHRIAERLGVTTRTVRRDLAEASDAFATPLSRREFADLVVAALGRLDDVQRGAWREHGSATTTAHRLRALETVRRAERTKFDLLKELGLLSQTGPETADEKPPGLGLSQAQRERLARLLIEDEFTDLAEPEPDDAYGGHGDDERTASPSQ